MASYLLELGTEEIPARFQPDLKEEFFQRMKRALEEADIEYSGLSVDVTPRRATLFIAEIAPMQRPIPVDVRIFQDVVEYPALAGKEVVLVKFIRPLQ